MENSFEIGAFGGIIDFLKIFYNLCTSIDIRGIHFGIFFISAVFCREHAFIIIISICTLFIITSIKFYLNFFKVEIFDWIVTLLNMVRIYDVMIFRTIIICVVRWLTGIRLEFSRSLRFTLSRKLRTLNAIENIPWLKRISWSSDISHTRFIWHCKVIS